MRINGVFSKKVSTGSYENETYTVTIEVDSDMSIAMIGETADSIFAEARAAVHRQIEASTDAEQSQKEMPHEKPEAQAPASDGNWNKNGGKGNPMPATEKQVAMVKKLLTENFRDGRAAKAWLHEKFGVDATTSLTRKVASRAIEALLDRRRDVA